jgi:hypothetical protein
VREVWQDIEDRRDLVFKTTNTEYTMPDTSKSEIGNGM